jgi:hypothetical protein
MNPNVTVEWLPFLFSVPEGPDSFLDPEEVYPDRGILWD